MQESGRVLVVGSPANEGNRRLVAGWRALGLDAMLVAAGDLEHTRRADIAVGRLDVLPTLDGVEPGLVALMRIGLSGVRVLNRPRSLVAAHDKLLTARLLARARVPHPRTRLVRSPEEPRPDPPIVVKPRFGSWGRDVYRCETEAEVESVLRSVSTRSWFLRHGAIAQELVPPRGSDLRLLVAAGRVVGSVKRTAAAGEWRTNVALGGSVASVDPPPQACDLALAAAAATACDFVGVDLLPAGASDYVVLELNGAVEFREVYGLEGRDVFRDLADALGLRSACFRETAKDALEAGVGTR